MRAAAPLAITGFLGLILLEVLKIVMEPVAAWLMGLLLVGLKIGLALFVAAIGLVISIFVVRRVMRSHREAEA